MENVDLIHAKEHLADLLHKAVRGEDVLISDPEIGTVRLQFVAGKTNETAPRKRRSPGRLQGVYKVPEGLFDPLPDDELKRWYGEE